MAEFKIDIDLSGLIQHQRVITAEVMPLLSQAVRTVLQQGAANWIEAVHRAKLWSGEKDAYAATIRYEMTGDFSGVIFSDYKHAEEIESGRPARDLKKMLDTSMKVRVTKKGTRYLVIPFRHGTPGNNAHGPSMPPAVYQMAKTLELSKITGHTKRLSGTGASSIKTQGPAMVRQRVYAWGGRLEGADVPKHQQGMVRMNTATGEGKKSSAYLTFRIMSENSNGWIVPPQPGLRLAENVANELRPLAERAFQDAVKRTVG